MKSLVLSRCRNDASDVDDGISVCSKLFQARAAVTQNAVSDGLVFGARNDEYRSR